jgi:hypothetical protein
MLSIANKMEDAGVSPDDIWQNTGWGRGADNKWRFEIDDSQSSYKPDIYDMPLSESYQHRDLYRAYPDAAELPLDKYMEDSLPYKQVPHGSYSPSDDVITIRDEFGTKRGRPVLAHESQHAIQAREGFGAGGAPGAGAWLMDDVRPEIVKEYNRILDNVQTPLSYEEYFRQAGWEGSPESEAKAAYKEYLKGQKKVTPEIDRDIQKTAGDNIYRRLAGEVEARNVEKRINMTPSERRALAPWRTEDVPRDEQIVRFGSGMNNAIEDAILGASDEFFRTPAPPPSLLERADAVAAPVNRATNWIFNAMEMPARGIHGLAATLGVLADTGDLEEALMRGGTVAGQPIDITAQELGRYMTDKTKNPYIGALTDAITRIQGFGL